MADHVGLPFFWQKKWQAKCRTATTNYPCFLPNLGDFQELVALTCRHKSKSRFQNVKFIFSKK
jgi:hypothetical protein